MIDPRIQKYQEAIDALPDTELLGEVPLESDDDISMLGRSIRELAERLAYRYEQERMLDSVSEKIVQGLYLKEVLDHVYESFRPLIPYDRMGCALLKDAGNAVYACWGRSDAPVIYLKEGFTTRMAGSSLQTIIDTGKPRIINDLEQYAREHPQSVSTRMILNEGLRSSLTCPLIALGKPIGFLFFSSSRLNCYENIHQEAFLRLAGLISTVVEKSKLYQELHELNKELTEARDALRVQATHDALTGLWNRGALTEILGKSFAQAKRQQGLLAVVLADIDHFKQVNDTYGHQAGDDVLRAVAKRIEAAAVRDCDYVGRYGGEEFLIILESCDADGACIAAERIRQAVRASPVEYENGSLDVTMSLGVVCSRDLSGLTPDKLIRLADDALYEAKKQGRDRMVLSA